MKREDFDLYLIKQASNALELICAFYSNGGRNYECSKCPLQQAYCACLLVRNARIAREGKDK